MSNFLLKHIQTSRSMQSNRGLVVTTAFNGSSGNLECAKHVAILAETRDGQFGVDAVAFQCTVNGARGGTKASVRHARGIMNRRAPVPIRRVLLNK